MSKLSIVFLVSVLFVFSSCAIQGSIEGGPKDTVAPQLLVSKCSPRPFTTNFTGSEISLEFDEFFKLNSPTSSIFVIPNSVKVISEAQDKKLTLKLEGELEKNTTYAIYFNNAIQDIHEGNDSLFSFVFSTGPWIDSLEFSGKVVSVDTKKTISNAIVGLFPDTIQTYLQKPIYFCQTNSEGVFSFKYLSKGTYKVLAFEDKNKDLIPQVSENIGFKNQVINLDSSFVDTIPYKVFPPKPRKFIRSFSFYPPSKFVLGLNGTIQDKELYVNDSIFIAPSVFYTYDSLAIFPPLPKNDSIHIFISEKGSRRDSIIYRIKEKEKQIAPIITYPNQVFNGVELSFSTSDIMEKIEPDSIRVFGDDSIKCSFKIVDFNPLNFKLKLDTNSFKSVTFNFLEKSISFKNYKEKFSSTNKLFINKSSDFGSLNLNVSEIDSNEILEIYLDKKKIHTYYGSTKDSLVHLEFLEKGSYTLKKITDTNRNKFWDTGNIETETLPELIEWYQDPIIIRPNWEIDIRLERKKWK